ncbi:GHMP family kinase ATP-binding protein [Alienimonas californiensis]|uniref:D-glycero-alpha-D-manno-heptose 7-phosphate kinase n=1 Tax=Alienimonas californiensis TaxID=2527989 RepID=A0A517PFE6_9PLAN|nr:GHMP kinase [Alienimonas californiensis]QDT18103.1 D-glycero-alpha-D-manno-heptose 7-phosphate kinase [Alienimonas californiensis]
MSDDAPTHRVRVPTRVDFAGGWTDVRDFCATDPGGGATLSCAITQAVEGSAFWRSGRFELLMHADLPADNHLGSSSSAGVAYLRLSRAVAGKQPAEPVDLAERAYRLAELVGEKGGKQDHYAAALGGVLHLRFGPEETPAQVHRIDLPVDRLRELERAVTLCYAAAEEDVSSGGSHSDVWERFNVGEPGLVDTLRALRETVAPARTALEAGDWERLGALTRENRELARRLDPGTVTPGQDRVFAAAGKAGAFGGKPCGAGGGGCLLLVGPPDRRAAIEEAARSAGATVMSFRVADRHAEPFS